MVFKKKEASASDDLQSGLEASASDPSPSVADESAPVADQPKKVEPEAAPSKITRTFKRELQQSTYDELDRQAREKVQKELLEQKILA